MIPGIRLKYNDLRRTDPETAREVVIQVYKALGIQFVCVDSV